MSDVKDQGPLMKREFCNYTDTIFLVTGNLLETTAHIIVHRELCDTRNKLTDGEVGILQW